MAEQLKVYNTGANYPFDAEYSWGLAVGDGGDENAIAVGMTEDWANRLAVAFNSAAGDQPRTQVQLTLRLNADGLGALEEALWRAYPGKCRSALGDLSGRSMARPARGWLTTEVLQAALEYGADINVVLRRLDNVYHYYFQDPGNADEQTG